MKAVLFSLVLTLAGLLPVAVAQDTAVDAALHARLTEAVAAASQNRIKVESIEPASLAGLYELALDNGEIVYIDAAGEHLLLGELYRVGASGLVNLSDARQRRVTASRIAALDPAEVIRFAPLAQTRRTVTVFTDVDCGFCRSLHSDIERLLQSGIEVRYLAFPRGGEASESFDKMVSVWCSDDRQRAITQAKRGQNLPMRDCESPVLAHYRLGVLLGISGTPAIITSDGDLIAGYAGFETLLASLGL